MKKYSLKTSLYRIFAISVLLPFLIICLCIPLFFRHQILDSYKTNNRIILQTLINHLDSSLQNSEGFYLQYLFDTNISRFYHYVNTYEIESSQETLYQYIRNSSKYRNSLNSYLTIANSTINGIGFIPEKSNENTVFYLQKYGAAVLRIQKENKWMESLREKLVEVSSGDVLILSESIVEEGDKSSENQTFTMLRPVKYLETGVRQGYAFLEISLDVFRDLKKAITLPKGAGLIIYYPQGEAAYATNRKFVETPDMDTAEREELGKQIQVKGVTHYRYRMWDEEYGFCIDYLLPESAILSEAYQTSLGILSVWFISIAAAFLVFMNLSRKISVSTEKIISYIDKYRLGDKESKDSISGMDIEEFHDISQALTDMNQRIANLVQHEYVWKMNQQMAEYKAMQAEINPHFFHNVMNSLQALNRIGDTKNLDKGIVNLSRMFRYTCESGYDSNIQKECRFIESYLMLEKLRFEDRLQYSIQIEPDLESFSIPKLLLQPLIENAMRHGMASDGTTLHIFLRVCKVSSWKGQDFVWITIANDGIPYRKEEIFSGERVGITNVRERLTITYPHSFFWYNRRGRFQTICNLLVPIGDTASEMGERYEDFNSRR
ncbi:MAG: histidine kinase [Blautia sp.]|jgi:two-component system sensor histidine kinase YesM